VGAGYRVTLLDGQMLTGQLLGLSKEALRLRTAWAEKVELPRAAVASLTQLPGWRTLADDDFADGLKAWTVTDKPTLEGGEKEPRRVVFKEAGQALIYKLSAPLEAGRVGVLFQEVDAAAGARWLCELQFRDKGEPRSLLVTLAGNGDAYEVEMPGLEGVLRRV